MMGTARWVLIGAALPVVLGTALGRTEVVSAIVLSVLVAAVAGISATYVRVRRERKAREKAHILRRVADLEGQHRPLVGNRE
jgi:hypothetical protein